MLNLDQLTGILIVLFILSIITEKLTNLIRKYPFQARVSLLALSIYLFGCGIYTLVRHIWGDLQVHWGFVILILAASGLLMLFLIAILILGVFGEKIIDKKKPVSGFWLYLLRKYPFKYVAKGVEAPKEQIEREVSLLSFITGMIVSALCNTNIFNLFLQSSKPAATDPGMIPVLPHARTLFGNDQWGPLFVLNPDFEIDFATITGFVATGFFLSFGSKFFHDILDTILQVKNLRRKQNQDFGGIESVKELEDVLYTTPGEMMQMAIDQNLENLKKVPGFVSVYVGVHTVNGLKEKAIMVDTSALAPIGFPKTLSAKLKSGKKIDFPVEVVPGVAIPKALCGTGSKVANPKRLDYVGTLTCALQDPVGNLLLLTCNHVLTNGDFINYNGAMVQEEPVTLLDDPQAELGSWFYGYQDNYFDVALIRPGEPVVATIQSSGIRSIMPYGDIQPDTVIEMNGAISGKTPGLIVGTNVSTQIAYQNMLVTMQNLIKLAHLPENQGPLSKAGDSGSLICTPDGVAIGMVIGGNEQFTYAVSMEKVTQALNMTIY